MRFTRDHLLKIARDRAEALLAANPRLVCIYLTGSLLGDAPMLGGTADIDLVLVHAGDPETAREIIPFNDDIHFDIAHVSQAVYREAHELRRNPWVGPYICLNPLLLHDTRHWFEFTQARICSQINLPEYVGARARALGSAARTQWIDLAAHTLFAGAGFTLGVINILEQAANAIACLTGAPIPQRRFLIQFPPRAEAIGKPGLYAGLTGLLGISTITAEELRPWLAPWRECLHDAGLHPDCPTRLDAARERYYSVAVETLLDDYPQAAAWLLLQTWAQSMCVVGGYHHTAGAWEAAANSLMLGAADTDRLVEALDAYLDLVEETIDEWCSRQGL